VPIPCSKYCDLENYILKDVRDKFICDKQINAFDFFCIIIWKANRAKTKIAQQILKHGTDIEQCVRDLTNKIYLETDEKKKLSYLYQNINFVFL